jgi:uncharacterized protein (TIGR03086 family)
MTTRTSPSPTTTDPRPALAAAARTACDVVAGVRPDQLTAPTPCREFDVRTLLGHLVSVFRRIAAVGRGEDPFVVPQVTSGIPDDGWAAAARAGWAEAAAAWADPALLARPTRVPYGTFPGAVVLATYTGEVSTHTWDLAAATGRFPAWDDAALRVALAASSRALPAEGRGAGIPFDPPVPVPDGAPLVDRLVGWQGRDPRWTPPAG